MLDELTIDFYDVESLETGVLAINDVASPQFLPSAQNNAIQSKTFYDVESIVLKLGLDRANSTGDGVSFRMTAIHQIEVPEPSVIFGLGAIVAGGLGLRKRQSSI